MLILKLYLESEKGDSDLEEKNKQPNKQTKKQLGAFYLTAKYNVDYTSKWSFENFVYHRTDLGCFTWFTCLERILFVWYFPCLWHGYI